MRSLFYASSRANAPLLTRIEMHELIERLWCEHRFTALLVTHDVQEAVALVRRILLMERGRIALDRSVDLARPRARGTAAFAAIEDNVLQRVLQQARRREYRCGDGIKRDDVPRTGLPGDPAGHYVARTRHRAAPRERA